MRKFILALCVISIVTTLKAAKAEDQEKESDSFAQVSSVKYAKPFIKTEIKDGLRPGMYDIQADLVLKNQVSPTVFESMSFELPQQIISPSRTIGKGWTHSNKTFLWYPNQEKIPLPLSLKPNTSAEDIPLGDLDGLQIDYEDLFLENLTELNLQMVVSGGKSGKKTLFHILSTKNQKLSSVFVLDVFSKRWRKKDLYYQGKRALGLSSDPIWVYSQDGANTVFQQRLHLDINSIESMDLVMQEGVSIKQIKSLVCNLKIGFGNPLSPLEVIRWDLLPKQIIELNGRKVFRINIKDYIRKNIFKKRKVYLEEIIFFQPGKPLEVIRHQLLEKINFTAPLELQLKPVEVVEVKKTEWKEKGFFDFFNHPAVNFWQYSENGTNTTVRRRFHKDLRTIEAMDFVFSSNIETSKVKLDLRFSFDDQGKTTEAIEGIVLRKGQEEILRIRIGELIRRDYTDKENIFLEEVKLSLPASAKELLQDNAFKKIVLHSQAALEITNANKKLDEVQGIPQIIHLPPNVKEIDQKRKRILIDFHNLIEKAGENSKIESITLLPAPMDNQSSGGFHLKSVKAISQIVEQKPLFLSQGEELSRRWGGPFLNLENEKDKVEWVKINGLFSFNKSYLEYLGREKNTQETPTVESFLPSSNKLVSIEDLSEQGASSSSAKFDNITIRSQLPLSLLYLKPGVLVLEGRGKWLEIDIPLPAEIYKNSRFFFAISEGSDEVSRIDWSPLLGNSQLSHFSSVPNHAVQFGLTPGKIDRLKIRLMLRKKQFKLKLKEIAIFQPVALTKLQALDFPRLIWKEIQLIPQEIQSPSGTHVSVNKGNLSSVIWKKTKDVPIISWTTKIDREMSSIGGFSLNYQIPREVFTTSPCWLQMTLTTPRHQVDHTICPPVVAGTTSIQAEDLFQGSGIQLDEVINSIHWRADLKGSVESDSHPLALKMNISLKGPENRSLRNELTQYPLLEWNGKNISTTPLTDFPAKDILSNHIKLKLGPVLLKGSGKESLPIRFLEHPHLKVQKVLLEYISPLPSEIQPYRTKFTLTPSSKSINYLKLLAFLFVFFVLAKVWRKGWFYFISIRLKKWATMVQSGARTAYLSWPTEIKRRGMFLNKAVGLIALGPGLLLAGSSGKLKEGLTGVAAILILLTGVLWHELRYWHSTSKKTTSAPITSIENNIRFKDWMFGQEESFPGFLYYLSFIFLGWVAWNLGFKSNPLLTFLPLLGLVYFYLPWIVKEQTRFWIMIATGFYLIGGLLPWGDDDVQFYKFGAVTIVLAWRGLLDSIHPQMKCYFPTLSKIIYREGGTIYIFGFLISLLLSGFLLVAGLVVVARETSLVGCFLLMFGVALESYGLWKELRKDDTEDAPLYENMSEVSGEKIPAQ